MKKMTLEEITSCVENITISKEMVSHAGKGGFISLGVELKIINGRTTTPLFFVEVRKHGKEVEVKKFSNYLDAATHYYKLDWQY